MVKIIDKLVLEFKNNFIDEKKLLLIGKEDNQEKERFIYYVRNYKGSRLSKKTQIRKEEALKLKQMAQNVKGLQRYYI